jgi:dTDP-4-amino-4,6-dideoxygalactose transaminase
MVGGEADAVREALVESRNNSARMYSHRVEAELSRIHGGSPAHFVTSCTAALHLSALLLDLEQGDEVIVPSFTFVSTAVAFASMGATIVFADIDPDTLCLSSESVGQLLTPRTRAVVTVHYGGVSAHLAELERLCRTHEIELFEDNAHGLGGRHQGRTLGTWGSLSTLSFDAQKNLQCGEGGGLIINDSRFVDRAHTLLERGTNRHMFMMGEIAEYTWIDRGGNFSPPDYVAAFLLPQMEQRQQIQHNRAAIWQKYHDRLGPWAEAHGVRIPTVPAEAESTHHIYWLLFPTGDERRQFITHMDSQNIDSPPHYTSLSLSPGARMFARPTETPRSDEAAECLVRLPLRYDLTPTQQDRVIDAVLSWGV